MYARRFFIVLIYTALIHIFSVTAFAQNDYEFFKNPFLKANSDLKRIGVDELQNMNEIEFEAENYRIDSSFRLGYGDIVNIDLWGKMEASYQLEIGKNGSIIIPQIGKMNIMGLTMIEAEQIIARKIDKKYANVQFNINLVDVENIRISVLGEVKNPGIYSISPFTRVVEGLARAGGPSLIGSVYDIRIIRDEKQVVTFNIYDFLFKADHSKNLYLKHGDTIFIPFAENRIAIRGDIKHPGIYDIKTGCKIDEAINTAGGMIQRKFSRKISVLRINPDSKLIERIKEFALKQSETIKPQDNIALDNQDTLIITTTLSYTPYPEDMFRQMTVLGEVKIPGAYIIEKNETLSFLLNRVGGLNGAAFPEGAVFTRISVRNKQESILDNIIRAQEMAILEEESSLLEAILTQEQRDMHQRAIAYKKKTLKLMASRKHQGRIVIDLGAILAGKTDMLLEKGDYIFIPKISDWVLVTGSVYNPSAIVYTEGEPLEFYLKSVGGPNKDADSDDVYIIKTNGSAESSGTGFGSISRGDIIVVPQKNTLAE